MSFYIATLTADQMTFSPSNAGINDCVCALWIHSHVNWCQVRCWDCAVRAVKLCACDNAASGEEKMEDVLVRVVRGSPRVLSEEGGSDASWKNESSRRFRRDTCSDLWGQKGHYRSSRAEGPDNFIGSGSHADGVAWRLPDPIKLSGPCWVTNQDRAARTKELHDES